MKGSFTRFDAAEYLKTPEEIAAYLDACLDEDSGDGTLIGVALTDTARATGTGLDGQSSSPLTRDIKHTLTERMRRDPAFVEALLSEAASLRLNGEFEAAQLLRDLIMHGAGRSIER
jgi:hypothetical protein